MAAGWAFGVAGLPLLTVLLANLRPHIGLPGDLMMYLLLVVAAATVGGIGPAIVTAVVSGLVVNWFFTPPYYTLTIATAGNGLAIVAFVIVGVVTSVLVTRAARQSVDAAAHEPRPKRWREWRPACSATTIRCLRCSAACAARSACRLQRCSCRTRPAVGQRRPRRRAGAGRRPRG